MRSLDRPVSELKQREVVTVQRTDHLDLADDIMKLGRVRHLPVLDGGRLVGLLSNRDLLAASLSAALDFDGGKRRAFLRAVEVEEVMSGEVQTTYPDERVDDAGRRMLRYRIGCLPVVDSDGVLQGLLSETDILEAALGVRDASPFEAELEQLRRVRDELRVQVHLGRAEAEALWEKLEQRLEDAEARVRGFASQAEEPVQDVADAFRHLIDEIRSGYQKLRDLS